MVAIFVVDCLVHTFQRFELYDAVAPNDQLSQVISSVAFRILNDHIQKRIVTPECPNNLSVSIQRQL